MKKQMHLVVCFIVTLLFALEIKAFVTNKIAMGICVAFAMWIPGIIAIIYAKKESLKLPIFSKKKKWYLFSTLFAYFTVVLSLLIAWIFTPFHGGETFIRVIPASIQSSLPLPITIALGVLVISTLIFIVGFTINALFVLGEELMWRGYLYEKLKGKPPLVIALSTGVIWGFWYAPIIFLRCHNYPSNPILGIFMMVIYCTLMSPIMHYIRVKSNSIFAPSIFHGTITAMGGFAQFFASYNPLYHGLTGFSGFVVLGVISMILIGTNIKMFFPSFHAASNLK